MALGNVARVEAPPVVGYAEGEFPVRVGEVDLGVARAAVAGDVRQGLLGDAEDGLFRFQRGLALAADEPGGR